MIEIVERGGQVAIFSGGFEGEQLTNDAKNVLGSF